VGQVLIDGPRGKGRSGAKARLVLALRLATRRFHHMSQIFPYKGNAVIPEIKTLDNGKFMACFVIHEGKDGSGKLRYQRKAPTNEFDTEDEAIAYILDFSGDWIDENPM
jgi:hypothetical protein